jgi:hypothetical protein
MVGIQRQLRREVKSAPKVAGDILRLQRATLMW